jgi:hypothetical protein
MFRTLSLIAAGVLFAAPALAQDKDAVPRQVNYMERTEISFTGVNVEGELVKPAATVHIDRQRGQFNPLIRLRQNFNSEIKTSVDQVK